MKFPPILQRSRAYKRTFLGDRGEPHLAAVPVLADLKRFCHAERPTVKVSPITGTIDTHAMAVAEGRREVWLRICAMLSLSESQVQQLREDFDDG